MAACARRRRRRPALPQFKQYREADGKFHFKLVDGEGSCCCRASASIRAREAGQLIARLKQAGAADLRMSSRRACTCGEVLLGDLAEGVAIDELVAALETFAEDAA